MWFGGKVTALFSIVTPLPRGKFAVLIFSQSPINVDFTFFKYRLPMENFSGKNGIGRKCGLFITKTHENVVFFITKEFEKEEKTFFSGISIFSDIFRNRKFLYPEKGGKGEKGRKCCFELSELSSKTTDVLL